MMSSTPDTSRPPVGEWHRRGLISSTRPVGGCCLYIKLSFVGIFVTLRDAGSSPRLVDGAALQVGCAGWILAAAVGCRSLARVGHPPCRWVTCWSRPVARWLDAGAAARLWMNNHPARLSVAENGHRRGLISWHHQGTAPAEGK